MKEGNNNWGYTIDEDDPINGAVDPDRGKGGDNNPGFSIDEDDPINGTVEDPEERKEAIDQLFEVYAGENAKKKHLAETALKSNQDEATPIVYRDVEDPDYSPEAKQAAADKPDISNPKVEKAENPVNRDFREKAERLRSRPNYDLTDKGKRAKETFLEALEDREEAKHPTDKPSYRLLSVAAVELERIEQPDNPEERVKKNNAEIEKAVKEAYGDDKLDDYANTTMAAAQLYISEGLIGKDAKSVSIGTAEPIVNAEGQVGEDPETYNHMVVIRWTKDDMNHVVAFSPRENSRIYSLVDDSMGDSWRETFRKAGAVGGKDREKIIVTGHEHKAHKDNRENFYYQEKTFETLAYRILEEESTAVIKSANLSPKEKTNLMSKIVQEQKAIEDAHSYERDQDKKPSQTKESSVESDTMKLSDVAKENVANRQMHQSDFSDEDSSVGKEVGNKTVGQTADYEGYGSNPDDEGNDLDEDDLNSNELYDEGEDKYYDRNGALSGRRRPNEYEQPRPGANVDAAIDDIEEEERLKQLYEKSHKA